MLTGNTETLITVTYQDGDGTIDFAVDNDLANYSNATSGFITDVVSDTTPQLGGNLDTNSNNILVDDNHGILDDSSNEQLWFQKTTSAVN